MFTFSLEGSVASQSLVSSPYTNEVLTYLQGTAAADHVAYLAWTLGLTATKADARALGEAIAAGNFQVTGLFGAAQSKVGGEGVNPADPSPSVTVNGINIDIAAMMGDDTNTVWWTTTQLSGKKLETTYHVREYFTSMEAPDGYTADWWVEPQAPEEPELTFTISLAGEDGTDAGSAMIAIPTGAATFSLEVVGDIDKLSSSVQNNQTENVVLTVEGYDTSFTFNGGETTGNLEPSQGLTSIERTDIEVRDLNNDGFIAISWTVSAPVNVVGSMSGEFFL